MFVKAKSYLNCALSFFLNKLKLKENVLSSKPCSEQNIHRRSHIPSLRKHSVSMRIKRLPYLRLYLGYEHVLSSHIIITYFVNVLQGSNLRRIK